ncbi:MAG TPA: DUF2231 domain-containing protein [Gemmatimonadales bacterium]|jgi:uncharacterized membrane protein
MLGYDWPRLHAALNDLPAALLLTAVIFDLLAAATRRPPLRQVGFWTMIAGAIGGVAAVISGLQAEDHIEHGEAVHEVMETHEKLALITLGIFAVIAVWRIVRERRMGGTERGVSLLASVGGLGVLIATAVYGGKLVFDHAAGIPSPVLRTELTQRAEGHHHHGGEEGEEPHEHGSEGPAAVTADSAHADSAGETAHTHEPAGHTHPPGTPPHKD